MRKLALVTVLTPAGCSDSEKTAAGIKSFAEACDGPITGHLVVSTFGNKLGLTCPAFKPTKEPKP